MVAEFLKQLSVSEDERTQLAKLGASSPLMLLNMRRVSQKDFDACFPERADIIANELEKLLTVEELRSLNEPLRVPGKLGSRLRK